MNSWGLSHKVSSISFFDVAFQLELQLLAFSFIYLTQVGLHSSLQEFWKLNTLTTAKSASNNSVFLLLLFFKPITVGQFEQVKLVTPTKLGFTSEPSYDGRRQCKHSIAMEQRMLAGDMDSVSKFICQFASRLKQLWQLNMFFFLY